MSFSLGADALSYAARQVVVRLDVAPESYDQRESSSCPEPDPDRSEVLPDSLFLPPENSLTGTTKRFPVSIASPIPKLPIHLSQLLQHLDALDCGSGDVEQVKRSLRPATEHDRARLLLVAGVTPATLKAP